MLLTSGENLVADLENASGIDTGIAETVLDQCSLDFQLRGMAGNKVCRKMVPNVDGRLLLPVGDADEEGLISAELVSPHLNTDGYLIRTRMFMSSPARLWNITDDTDVFVAGDYYVELVSKLLWENLDTPVQRAIMATAIRQYQTLTQGDPAADQYLSYQEQIFNARGRAADVNDKKRNIFHSGDASVRRASDRTMYSNDPSLRRYWRL